MALSPTLARVSALRGRLLLDQPFFGVLALRLRLLEDATCDTAWTDGTSMGFSPTFVASLSDDEVIALIAHEVMHCACGHPWRRDARDHSQWNVAADHAINHVLASAAFQLPAGALMDPQFAGCNAEYIYSRLPVPDPQGNGNGNGGQQPQAGEVRDAPAPGANPGDEPALTESDWQQAATQAAKLTKGSTAGNTVAALQAAAHTAIDWRSLLARYMTERSAADYSWQRPSTRYAHTGVILPSLHTPSFGALVVAIDTSCSVDDVLVGQFMAEIATIADSLQPSEVIVLQCDTDIRHAQTFTRGERPEVSEIYGRGGTSFVPVFEHVEREQLQPAALVYLTDYEGDAEHCSVPDYPVLWCVYGACRHDTPAFGDLIPCE